MRRAARVAEVRAMRGSLSRASRLAVSRIPRTSATRAALTLQRIGTNTTMNSMFTLALLAPAAAISFGSKKATTVANPFESMPGGFGWAQSKGLTYSFGKPFSQEKFPDLVPYVQEAEIKHARVAMLAAVGFPLQEQFHPLFGGDIDAPSYISFHMTPLQTFWPIVVSAIFLLEANTALQTFKDPTEALWALKEDHQAGDLGFDPLNFGAKADLRAQELAVGRLAMLGIAGMVAQEVSTQAWLFTWFETI